MNKSNRFLFSFIGLILFQIFMSLEELTGGYPQFIKIVTQKIHIRIPSIPVIEISNQLFMFSNLIIIIILFVFLGLVFTETKWSGILAIILGIIEILNGAFHIISSIHFKMYIPGTISAIGLIIFGFLIIFIRPSFQEEETEKTPETQ
jgi:hypothetical protein